MALFTPSESPAVTFKEIDLTGGVPNVQSTTGAMVGNFTWGPAKVATHVSNDTELAKIFGKPTTTNNSNIDFLSATNFLRYSGNLYVVREVTAATKNATSSGAVVTSVNNREHWETLEGSFGTDSGDLNTGSWIAKYPGALGNSLLVSICVADPLAFNAWEYASSFDAAPGTSDYVAARGSSNDEVHIAIVDEDGAISGSPGAVLETFPFVSLASDAKNADGSTNYAYDVINGQSSYVWLATWESVELQNFTHAGKPSSDAVDHAANQSTAVSTSLTGGVDTGALTITEYLSGFDLFEDADTITVDFLIAPSMAGRADQSTIVNDLVSTASSVRKDCIVVASPARTDIVGATDPTGNTVATAETFTRSSYLFVDSNFLKVYDTSNDTYVHIPAASSTAGIMAAADNNAAPWFSPAGTRRGAYLGVTALAYNQTKAQRDTLYKAGVNPVANIPGQGILLYGDKTFMNRPSAFDRINVRRLFLVLERSISEAAKSVMFEFNDEFTRASFANLVVPVLRDVQGRRGIIDYKVVCDTTNNTPDVVDRNEFIADIFIKPSKSINYVSLNFVAVRTGVEFSEVVGTV